MKNLINVKRDGFKDYPERSSKCTITFDFDDGAVIKVEYTCSRDFGIRTIATLNLPDGQIVSAIFDRETLYSEFSKEHAEYVVEILQKEGCDIPLKEELWWYESYEK